MANWSEVVPPIAAIVAISSLEWFFPENQFDKSVGLFKSSLANTDQFNSLRFMVNHLALGWQTTVDLVYTILASMTVFVSRALQNDLQPTRPVFWTLVVLLLLNVGLLVWCANTGPEGVVSAPVWVPVLRRWRTPRQICFTFVIAANLIVIAATCSEFWFF
jgi:hypothetical protein